MTRTEAVTVRAALGLTQADLARVLGVHPMTVGRWERDLLTLDGDNAEILHALLPWTAAQVAGLGVDLRGLLATRGHLAARHALLGAVLDIGAGRAGSVAEQTVTVTIGPHRFDDAWDDHEDGVPGRCSFSFCTLPPEAHPAPDPHDCEEHPERAGFCRTCGLALPPSYDPVKA